MISTHLSGSKRVRKIMHYREDHKVIKIAALRPRRAALLCSQISSEPAPPAVSASDRASASDCNNVFREGSPSRMRIVLRISLGITIRPRSSILRTIPVAFIYHNSFHRKSCFYVCTDIVTAGREYIHCFDKFQLRFSAVRYQGLSSSSHHHFLLDQLSDT